MGWQEKQDKHGHLICLLIESQEHSRKCKDDLDRALNARKDGLQPRIPLVSYLVWFIVPDLHRFYASLSTYTHESL